MCLAVLRVTAFAMLLHHVQAKTTTSVETHFLAKSFVREESNTFARWDVERTGAYTKPDEHVAVTSSPGCTFYQLPPSATLPFTESLPVNTDIGGCLKFCYEFPLCAFAIFYPTNRSCFAGADDRVDHAPISVADLSKNGAEVYQLDRSVTNASCPTMEHWLADRTQSSYKINPLSIEL